MRIEPASRLQGTVQVPGDKSVSHRCAILGAMARGRTLVRNFSASADCTSTLDCVQELGVGIRRQGTAVEIQSPGWQELSPPRRPLDAGNSGTTIRLLAGLLAGREMTSLIAGDDSLNQRPMRRIVEPLAQMGARIIARDGEYPPLEIHGNRLQGIRYELPVASAQVKSCVLLAGLTAVGRTVVVEPVPTRDHTERALPQFGVAVERNRGEIAVEGPAALVPTEIDVPGDLSSAVFLLTAALLVPESTLLLPAVGVNPSRSAILGLLEQAGASIRRQRSRQFGGEPVCDLEIDSSSLPLARFPAEISGPVVANLIDEIPALAVLGTRLPRGITIRGASELRKKESDRIRSIVTNLAALGVAVEEFPDGLAVPYTPRVRGGRVRTWGDHRIAMAFAVLGLISEEGVELDDPACAAVSFPDFYDYLAKVTR